jgi:hypothetical protein
LFSKALLEVAGTGVNGVLDLSNAIVGGTLRGTKAGL